MLSEVHQGKLLQPLVRDITQDRINLYARASGDFNPIHVDETFAANTPFGGTIAHGMLVLAYVSEMMTLAFGQSWISEGKLQARFKEAARPGDTVTIKGRIDSIKEDNGNWYADCTFECSNQRGAVIVAGQATVRLPTETRITKNGS